MNRCRCNDKYYDLDDECENTLTNDGVIDYRKDANFIYNHINDHRILELIEKMRELYLIGC